MTPVEVEFSYDIRVLRVVENQPFSLEWATSIEPFQVYWFDQWSANLASIVGAKDKWMTTFTLPPLGYFSGIPNILFHKLIF